LIHQIRGQAVSLQQTEFKFSISVPEIVCLVFKHIILLHKLLYFFPITQMLMMFFLTGNLFKAFSLAMGIFIYTCGDAAG